MSIETSFLADFRCPSLARTPGAHPDALGLRAGELGYCVHARVVSPRQQRAKNGSSSYVMIHTHTYRDLPYLPSNVVLFNVLFCPGHWGLWQGDGSQRK